LVWRFLVLYYHLDSLDADKVVPRSRGSIWAQPLFEEYWFAEADRIDRE